MTKYYIRNTFTFNKSFTKLQEYHQPVNQCLGISIVA